MHWRKKFLKPDIFGVLLTSFTAFWIFIGIAGKIARQPVKAIDTTILLSLQGGPRWLEDLVRDITALGSPGVLSLVVAVATVFLLLARKYRNAIFMLVTSLGGVVITALLKFTFDRPRPELALQHVYADTASFPSAHAMLSIVVYLAFGLLATHAVTERALKCYVLGVAVLLGILVGFSRIYLGMHWPSDVLAGWSAGISWVLACWIVLRLGDPDKGD